MWISKRFSKGAARVFPSTVGAVNNVAFWRKKKQCRCRWKSKAPCDLPLTLLNALFQRYVLFDADAAL